MIVLILEDSELGIIGVWYIDMAIETEEPISVNGPS